MTKIKICGLTRPCDIDAVNVAKPDYIGFVFADSRRKVTPQQAAELRQRLNPCITSVGVFVNEAIEDIISLAESGVIDVIQLHGDEDEEYITQLKMQTDKLIIKAISVQQKGDVQKWLQTTADYLLLDSKGGGTGRTFDWNLLGDDLVKPFFLAGGLGFDNIEEALNRIKPFAIDVSSGAETDGFKDAEKIDRLVELCRPYNQYYSN